MNRLALVAVLVVAGVSAAEDLAPQAFAQELEKQKGLVLDVRTPR